MMVNIFGTLKSEILLKIRRADARREARGPVQSACLHPPSESALTAAAEGEPEERALTLNRRVFEKDQSSLLTPSNQETEIVVAVEVVQLLKVIVAGVPL